MSYTASELATEFRKKVDDLESPYLWSDDEVYDYMDEAQKEFARGVDILTETFTLAHTAGDPLIAISDRVTKIRRARLVSTGKSLDVKTMGQIDTSLFDDDYGIELGYFDWEDSVGTPRMVITDYEPGYIRAVPYIPAAGTDDQIKIWTYRLPETDVTGSGSTLEITERNHQRILLVGMMAQAYAKQDSEVRNSQLADKYAAEFEYKVERANRRIRRLRKPAGCVRYGGL